jgi:hypothetical protein
MEKGAVGLLSCVREARVLCEHNLFRIKENIQNGKQSINQIMQIRISQLRISRQFYACFLVVSTGRAHVQIKCLIGVQNLKALHTRLRLRR